MQLGMIGLGRMGANMAQRLIRGGHTIVGYVRHAETVEALLKGGAITEGATTLPDLVIDGGNSYYHDDIRRAVELKPKGIHYVDCGTSGGVWGLERGYCLMIGGEEEVVQHLDPIFSTLAPGINAAPRTTGREKVGGTAEQGYLRCGPNGAGHFVKMVHNGIEYGIMSAYAEGLNILHHANVGKQERTVDAETSPLRNPEYYQYDLNLSDVAELWRRGSV